MSSGSAGYDLFAAEEVTIPPSATDDCGCVDIGRGLVPVGIAIEIPTHTVGRIGSRSGLSTEKNIEVGAGWIDSDYRGELMVELKNLSSTEFVVRPGDRIAQLIVLPIVKFILTETEQLQDTARGIAGFGSTDET